MLEITLCDVRREIIDLDRTEQKAEREYLGAVRNGRVTTESSLSVHYQQRHLIYKTLRSLILPGITTHPEHFAT